MARGKDQGPRASRGRVDPAPAVAPMVMPGGWLPKQGRWLFRVTLTPDQIAALQAVTPGEAFRPGNMADTLGKVIDEALADAMPKGGSS